MIIWKIYCLFYRKCISTKYTHSLTENYETIFHWCKRSNKFLGQNLNASMSSKVRWTAHSKMFFLHFPENLNALFLIFIKNNRPGMSCGFKFQRDMFSLNLTLNYLLNVFSVNIKKVILSHCWYTTIKILPKYLQLMDLKSKLLIFWLNYLKRCTFFVFYRQLLWQNRY